VLYDDLRAPKIVGRDKDIIKEKKKIILLFHIYFLSSRVLYFECLFIFYFIFEVFDMIRHFKYVMLVSFSRSFFFFFHLSITSYIIY
jgi:hypothetical protein